MFLVDTILSSSRQTLSPIYEEIDRCMAKLSTVVLNNKRYRSSTCLDVREDFLRLSDYKEILQYKEYCDSCLKDWPMSQIIHQIRTITNKIQ